MLSRVLSFAVLSAGSVWFAGVASVSAQTTNPAATPQSQQALQELRQGDQSIYAIGGGSNLNVMQLIHNASNWDGKSPERAREEQNESLNEAVLQFRSQQRQKLGTPPQPQLTPVK